MEKKSNPHNTAQKAAMYVSSISIIVNLLLSLFKLIAGIIARSDAMISDAVHSASDVLSTIVVIVGSKISSKESDTEHPYGHERIECVSSIILSGMLLVTGIGIGIVGVKKIIAGSTGDDLTVPGILALMAAVVSIIVKEWMYWFTRSVAKKINSGSLMADAWHHRSDALSSIGSFAGILGARLGYPILDSIASVIICVVIVKVSMDIFYDAINKMVDHSCNEATEDKIRSLIATIPGIRRIDLLHTRLFGMKIYVDIEIAVDENLRLKEAHHIAEQVHYSVENSFPEVKHCMVHVNPASTVPVCSTK